MSSDRKGDEVEDVESTPKYSLLNLLCFTDVYIKTVQTRLNWQVFLNLTHSLYAS